jgi:hypothetical protein
MRPLIDGGLAESGTVGPSLDNLTTLYRLTPAGSAAIESAEKARKQEIANEEARRRRLREKRRQELEAEADFPEPRRDCTPIRHVDMLDQMRHWGELWRCGYDHRATPGKPPVLIGLAAVDPRHYVFHADRLRERQDQRYATYDIPYFGECN